MCDYWANRYQERSPSERSCLEAPLGTKDIRLLRALPKGGGDAVLLHTDLQAGNVLAAEREPWLAIDPKPYVGDPIYDVTQHIFNGVLIEVATLAPSPPGWRACSISIPAGSCAGSLPGPSKRRRTGPEWQTWPGPSTPPCPSSVGGRPDLPAGGHEEDTMAITERDRIR
jgi:Aminoglycoside/hydroxyurea antibiotic resistance kinase